MSCASRAPGPTKPGSVQVEFSRLGESNAGHPALTLFSVVRNEAYFLPHLLQHYRRLGVGDFLFLDDHSTDGTLEFLLAQPDCGVLKANLRFGESYGSKRFGVAVKTLLPRKLLQDRWVLTVDADEFLILPKPFADVDALTAALGRAGLKEARALMFDFFPPTLRSLEGASPQADPFSLCPFFDAWERTDWPDGAPQPVNLSNLDGVRPRMFAQLRRASRALEGFPESYRVPSMYKVPLVYWEANTEMLSPHHVNRPSSDRIRLGLAHFKFFPGYRERIAEAIASRAYWQDSIEYRFLEIAARELADWPLAGPRSRRFESADSLGEAGLVYSRV